MRILLVQPDVSTKMVGFSLMIRTEPLALEMVAGGVLDEHEVKILDLRVDPTPLAECLKSYAPDVVGVTGYTTAVPRMHKICAEVNAVDPSIMTVTGGYHASLCPQDFDEEYVDVIVQGEGEVTFRKLIQALERKADLAEVSGITFRRDGKQVTTLVRPLHRNLDSLPLPARNLSDQYRHDYHFHFWENPYTVETSRGCPYRCTFCSVWKFHQLKCRFRSPERVVEDMKRVKSDIIAFVDDNFFQSFRRAERLYELIKEAGIKAQYWGQLRSDSIVKRQDGLGE